eukprot:CAMPEP_0169235102 /NCGR_PEP_ID=MMETSP1016-20121227/28538_1 /TAXON_ID=342587 /ORGANISM="Karlodinium micrum, Strain CCMP2283" /LENGTH=87 /DNA_ID=CAMNT_0009314625 /DNA_START=389 /DNA_END=652 /DNA_ORIENTATION=+
MSSFLPASEIRILSRKTSSLALALPETLEGETFTLSAASVSVTSGRYCITPAMRVCVSSSSTSTAPVFITNVACIGKCDDMEILLTD